MARENAFRVEGVVVEALPNRTYRVELINGHRVLAFFVGRERQKNRSVAVGEKVMLEMSPYDLSQGRLLIEKENLDEI